LGFILDEITGDEVDRVYLEVRVSNSAAIGLYEKFGFKQSGTRKSYYRGPQSREDAILMELMGSSTLSTF